MSQAFDHRSTAEVIGLVNELIKKQVRIIAIKQNLDMKQHDMTSKVMITLFSLFAELERDLISLRTKEVLANKKATDPVRKTQGNCSKKQI